MTLLRCFFFVWFSPALALMHQDEGSAKREGFPKPGVNTILLSPRLPHLAAVAAMPRDRVLPESDGPSSLMNGQPIYPWDAWSIVQHLADVWREPERDVGDQLLSNFKTLAASQYGGRKDD